MPDVAVEDGDRASRAEQQLLMWVICGGVLQRLFGIFTTSMRTGNHPRGSVFQREFRQHPQRIAHGVATYMGRWTVVIDV